MADLPLDDPEESGELELSDDHEEARDDDKRLAPHYQSDHLSHHAPPKNAPYLVASRFQGELPPPNLFAGYEKILPGLANRLVLQMEKNGGHRRFMDKASLILRQGRSYLGLGAGLFIVLNFLDVSYKLVVAGHDVAGTVLGTIDLVALAAVFVGIRQTSKENKLNDQQPITKPKKPARKSEKDDESEDEKEDSVS